VGASDLVEAGEGEAVDVAEASEGDVVGGVDEVM